MPDSLILEVTTEAFPAVVVAASLPVLVEFFDPSSVPPGAPGDQLEALAVEYEGRLLIVRVDAQNEPALAAAFGIRSFPAAIIYLEGSPIKLITGLEMTASLRDWAEGHFAQ